MKKKYAQKLSDNKFANESGRIWYLPHFGVRNLNKPVKFRFVFDVAAKYESVSMNDALISGTKRAQAKSTEILLVWLKFCHSANFNIFI